MKKTFESVALLFSITVSILLPAASSTSEVKSEVVGGMTWYYRVISSGFQRAMVIGCDRMVGAVSIPQALGNRPVVEIGEGALSCRFLTSVTMPSGVTSIGDAAFSDNSDLVSLSIPLSVTSIGDRAFDGCTRLESIMLPQRLERIGAFAFSRCEDLSSVTIPLGVVSVEDCTFCECRALSSATIPISVTNIGWEAFAYCEELSSLTIPSSVTSIGKWAFRNCGKLSSFYFEGAPPQGVTNAAINKSATVRYNVKYESEWLQVVRQCGWTNTMPYTPLTPEPLSDGGPYKETVDGIEWTYMVSRGNAEICSGSWYTPAISKSTVGPVAIPLFLGGRPVTGIGNYAFNGCDQLTSVVMSSFVSNVGTWAFMGCSGLTNVVISTRITNIGESAFAGCSGLTSIDFPPSLQEIGPSAFWGCDNLKVVNIQDLTAWCGIRFNGYNGFPLENVERLFVEGEEVRWVIINDNCTDVGKYAFYGCRVSGFMIGLHFLLEV